MPYKYVAKTESINFDDASPIVRRGRSRLNWAARALLNDCEFSEFNELLALGYLEGQKIDV